MGEKKGIPITINGYYIVGYVVGDEFRKRVHGRNHFLRQPPAIAFNVDTLEEASVYGAKIAHIHDLDTNTDYYATIADILKDGFQFDRGYGPQVGLPIQEWRLRRPSEQQESIPAERSVDNNE